jgi:NADH-quinone oxidoreductase subunit N
VPDVYESSPTFVVFFLSVVVKGTFFLYLIKLLAYVFFDLNFFCSVILALSGVSSILIGSVGGLVQGNIKRLFGYASVNQLGFLLIGLSISNYISFKITIFYFFIYIIVASTFLFTVSSSYNDSAGRSIQFFSELKSLPKLSNEVSSTVPLHFIFLFSVFSMCGLPPLAGFFAKYFLMFEVLSDGSFSMVVFILIGSAISAFYYLKLAFQLVSYGGTVGPDHSNDKYSFEGGYQLKRGNLLLHEYPVVQLMDIGAFIVFYMPLIL